MIYQGQKIRTFIDNKVVVFLFKKIQNNNFLCVDKNGNEISLNPLDCRVGNYNYMPLIIKENQVGLKYNEETFYTTKHSLQRALSKGLIMNKYHYINLIHKTIKNGVRYSKINLAAIIEISLYGEEATFIISKSTDVVLVIREMKIITIYSLSGSKIMNHLS
jgi:hypothetical protein